jgi:hypothetical protein
MHRSRCRLHNTPTQFSTSTPATQIALASQKAWLPQALLNTCDKANGKTEIARRKFLSVLERNCCFYFLPKESVVDLGFIELEWPTSGFSPHLQQRQ